MLSFLYSQLSNIWFPHFYICDWSGRDFPFLNNCVLVHVCACTGRNAPLCCEVMGAFPELDGAAQVGGDWLLRAANHRPGCSQTQLIDESARGSGAAPTCCWGRSGADGDLQPRAISPAGEPEELLQPTAPPPPAAASPRLPGETLRHLV